MPTIVTQSTRPRAEIASTARGLIAEAFPYHNIQGTTAVGAIGVNSTMLGVPLGLRAGDVLTNGVLFNAATATAGTLAKMGLFTKAGVFLKATADFNASLPGNNFLQVAWGGGAYTVPSDDLYYITLLTLAGTTQATFARGLSVTGSGNAVGSGSMGAVQVVTQTDITGNVTFAATGAALWLAVS